MSEKRPRMARERKTVAAMISLYCNAEHRVKGLCPDCTGLRDYALERLEKCPFQEGKTVCSRCPVHCYKSSMRDGIRAAMRYAGPRMIYRHPLMALFHLIDRRRQELLKPVRKPGVPPGA